MRPFRPNVILLGVLASVLTGCEPEEPPVPGDPPLAAAAADVHRAFLENLSHHCGEAFRGSVIHAPDDDPAFGGDPSLVMHVRECDEEEVRIPVFLDDDASRTWIFTLTSDGVDLRHDHRNPDGTPEATTFYGAFVSEPPVAGAAPSPTRHEFKYERVEDGMPVGWVVEILPGERYTYGTQRDGQWRHRFDFDLSSAVEPPPDPWGHPPVGEVAELAPAQEAFWTNLEAHCGEAFHGELVQRPDTDQLFRGDEVMTVHFRGCGEHRMALPFHVEENRSRTWLLTRTTAGIDLRHDHRHPDGTPEPESNTWYGAHTADEGTANRQEFLRSAQEGQARTGWAIEIHPGERYTYGTIRDGEWSYRIDFDLSVSVEEPPPPWGHDGAPGVR